MGNMIHVRIVTPAAEAVELDCAYLNLPTERGPVGVLRRHAPLVCTLTAGVLLCRKEDGEELRFRLEPGVARVAHDSVTVLCAGAEKEE